MTFLVSQLDWPASIFALNSLKHGFSQEELVDYVFLDLAFPECTFHRGGHQSCTHQPERKKMMIIMIIIIIIIIMPIVEGAMINFIVPVSEKQYNDCLHKRSFKNSL